MPTANIYLVKQFYGNRAKAEKWLADRDAISAMAPKADSTPTVKPTAKPAFGVILPPPVVTAADIEEEARVKAEKWLADNKEAADVADKKEAADVALFNAIAKAHVAGFP